MISMLLNNILWAGAVFVSIIVWSKTRDSSWIFLILAVIAFYISVVYRTLIFFGIIMPGILIYKNIDILSVFFESIPVVILILALIIKAAKNLHR
jgi:hypothetical protein